MKKSGKCPKCGSGDIIADAKVVDRASGGAHTDMTVATFGKPEALIFKQKTDTVVSAWICSSCGFVELYADDPRRLRPAKR